MNAVIIYRISNRLFHHRVKFLPTLLRRIIFFLYNSDIPPECEIGEGSWFAHGGVGVVLNKNSKIGKRVLIGQNCTIGGTFGSGVPVIGDDVWIGPGVRILGDISIGSNVILGANAVVLQDIPDNCIVAGVPAKLIRPLPPGSLDTKKGILRHLG